MRHEYKAVIFDLDGTLVNTLGDLTDSVNAVLKKEGYPLRTEQQVRKAIGEGYRVLIGKSLPEGTEETEIDCCTGLFEQHYLSNLVNKTQPYEEIKDLLHTLKARGIKIGVVSNKMDEATKEVCRHYFGTLIDVAVGDNPFRKRKPAPDNIYEALKQLESVAEDSVYIGDSHVDVQTARNASISFIGVSWGYRSKEVLIQEGAEKIADHPGEILKILDL